MPSQTSAMNSAERKFCAAWKQIWKELGAAGDPLPPYRRLIYEYGDPERIHHGMDHPLSMIREQTPYTRKMKDPVAVKAVDFLHDVKNETRSQTNVTDSAKITEEIFTEAKLPSSRVEDIKEGVLDTDHERTPHNKDCMYAVDSDLAIFGQPRPVFIGYEKAIRGEYFWVPEKDYREVRARILEGFYKREPLFHTPEFRDKYEDIAKRNLAFSIKYLRSDKPILTPFKHIAIYPGSFDPPTLGHEYIMQRAARLFDLVIVAVGTSGSKDLPMFTQEERYQMLRALTRTTPNLRADYYRMDYTVFYAQSVGAEVMIRGDRNLKDYEEEKGGAQVNKILAPKIDTLIINSPPHLQMHSSSLVKEVVHYKGWPMVFNRWEEAVSHFVSQPVVEMLQKAHQKSVLADQAPSD